MTGRIGVAISTTGDVHRLGLLEQCAQAWWRALAAKGLPTTVYVTVDGDEDAVARVARAVMGFAEVYRVGQGGNMKIPGVPQVYPAYEGTTRLGVAVNKNTGIELLMDSATDIEHLFLCDDDTWPLLPQSIDKHLTLNMAHDVRHSMVCWGGHRLSGMPNGALAYWTWPRGVMLYARRNVIETIGGMDERFGPGGHEHVEWSQRIYNAGLTPQPFCSPASYGTREGYGARALWHAEDMRRPGEKLGDHRLRRRNLTSVRRRDEDWDLINEIMDQRQGSRDFLPYQAHENGRGSATLCGSNPSQGAEESK